MLVDVALSDTFPELCNTLRAAVENTCKRFYQELIKRQAKAYEELCRQEPSLQRALLDAVVEDVMKLFP
jgi:hypothetical protein